MKLFYSFDFKKEDHTYSPINVILLNIFLVALEQLQNCSGSPKRPVGTCPEPQVQAKGK